MLSLKIDFLCLCQEREADVGTSVFLAVIIIRNGLISWMILNVTRN